MSQIQILSPRPGPIDFDISRTDYFLDANRPWGPTSVLVNGIISSSPLRITAESPLSFFSSSQSDASRPSETSENLSIFPSLPPLLNGHPDLHLRKGIMKASLAEEPDAEKAFFVADICEVYRQHLRWKAALPQIEPFYGLLLYLLSFSFTNLTL